MLRRIEASHDPDGGRKKIARGVRWLLQCIAGPVWRAFELNMTPQRRRLFTSYAGAAKLSSPSLAPERT